MQSPKKVFSITAQLNLLCLVFFSLLLLNPTSASASTDKTPEPFQGDTPDSPYTISYDDLNVILDSSVVSKGRSQRAKAKTSRAVTGTRLKNKVNRLTAFEANRFWFEAFKDDEAVKILASIRDSLAKVPSEAPLKLFTKKEQLAYWLNLYNVTVLHELAAAYPIKSVKDLIKGDESIFEKKLLTVADINLSLNDIQYKILKNKFSGDPLIIYGLYQGNIGGPNIRNQAYTAKSVYNALVDNAEEFINSNRGTYADNRKYFRVSSFYERNEDFFPDFEQDLRNHLLYYLEDDLAPKLESANRIKTNINDWNITDLFGTARSFGAGIASNSAALLDSAGQPERNQTIAHFDGNEVTLRASGSRAGGEEGNAGFTNPILGAVSESYLGKTVSYGRFSKEQAEQIKKLLMQKMQKTGTVSISQDSDEGSND